jgi:caffeoyl-CoA O-methyltransferase
LAEGGAPTTFGALRGTDYPRRVSNLSIGLSPELNAYVQAHSSPQDAILADLVAETAGLGGNADMQIAPEEGAFLTVMAQLVGAKSAVEVGTFTGYSSICIARGLQPGGRLLCCDVSEEWTSVARRYWDRGGLADRIDLVLAPAIQTLAALPADATVDLAFIDAEKTGYLGYWEQLVPRVRPGGVLIVDNVLRGGRVVEPSPDVLTAAIQAFNARVVVDERVAVAMLPLADGVTVAVRR